MSLRQPRDTGPTGPKRTISAASIASALGLKDAPPAEPPMPDSPAAARLRAAGRDDEADALMEAVKENFATGTIPAGRDVLDFYGGDAAAEHLPVGVEAELDRPTTQARPDAAAPAPRPENRDDAKARAVLGAAAREGKRMVEEARANGNADPETVKAAANLAERIIGGLKRLGQ